MSGRGPRPCSRRARRPGHSVLSGPDSSPERPATAILWWAEDRREAPARYPAGNRRQHPLTMEQALPPPQPRGVVWPCPWQRLAELNRWPASDRDWAPVVDRPSMPDHGEPGQPEQGQALGRTTDSGQRSEQRRPEPSRSEPPRPDPPRPDPQLSEPPRLEPPRARAGRPARRRPAVPRRAAAPGQAMESRPPRQLEEPRLAID